MYEIEKRLDSVKAQMESHLLEGSHAMSHFYLPPSMLDIHAMLTAMLPFNIRSMVNLISDKSLRSVARETGKGKPSGDRTRHLFEFSTEGFEKWSVDVVVVKPEGYVKKSSHMPQLSYGNTSGAVASYRFLT